MPVAFTNLPFKEAIRFIRGKVNLPTRTWTDLQREMHSRSFVIAGAMQDDLIQDIRDAVTEGIEEGIALQQFKKEFKAIVKKRGWTFKQSPGWRSRVIFNTNLRTAFAAGSERQMQRTARRRPFAKYIAGLSAEPRPEHLIWNGRILPLDHPWWATHTPPNGWGCKCIKVSVSRRELDRDGLEVLQNVPDEGTYQWTNPKTGKVEQIPVGIDPLWDYNPGRDPWSRADFN